MKEFSSERVPSKEGEGNKRLGLETLPRSHGLQRANPRAGKPLSRGKCCKATVEGSVSAGSCGLTAVSVLATTFSSMQACLQTYTSNRRVCLYLFHYHSQFKRLL